MESKNKVSEYKRHNCNSNRASSSRSSRAELRVAFEALAREVEARAVYCYWPHFGYFAKFLTGKGIFTSSVIFKIVAMLGQGFVISRRILGTTVILIKFSLLRTCLHYSNQTIIQ